MLAKTSFAGFSILIAILVCWPARGGGWLVWLLAILAAASAIWALAGIYNPRALFFAGPRSQTRENAFLFPMRLFFTFAFCAVLESHAASRDVTLFVIVFPLVSMAMALTRAGELSAW